MRALLDLAYELTGQLASGLVSIVPASDSKLLRTFSARRGVLERFAEWGRTHRDPTRPLIWFHAPSYGEGLQARPVIERIRARQPQTQLAYTFFSPSAEGFARGLPVDVTDYLPFDTREHAEQMLRALQPSALVFSKLDVWPMLTRVLSGAGVPLGIISATMSPAARRRQPMAQSLLRNAYASLRAVGAIATEDAERLIEAGVSRQAVRITGDTRYDQVWARATTSSVHAALVQSLRSDRPTLVAGSTWPADERVLCSAWLEVRHSVRDARLVIAPHEPSEANLTPVVEWAERHQIPLARLTSPEARMAEVVLVDRVGVLGDLYALGQAAFVGGGFHSAGLHSVLEPAAFGVPVVFGPHHMNSRDAGLLLDADAAATVSTASDAADVISRWLGNAARAAAAGEHGRAIVERGVGAADRAYDLVMGLLPTRSLNPTGPAPED